MGAFWFDWEHGSLRSRSIERHGPSRGTLYLDASCDRSPRTRISIGTSCFMALRPFTCTSPMILRCLPYLHPLSEIDDNYDPSIASSTSCQMFGEKSKNVTLTKVTVTRSIRCNSVYGLDRQPNQPRSKRDIYSGSLGWCSFLIETMTPVQQAMELRTKQWQLIMRSADTIMKLATCLTSVRKKHYSVLQFSKNTSLFFECRILRSELVDQGSRC